MNLEWEQNWLQQFNNNIEALMANYPDAFEYEDLVLGIRIDNDKPALRTLFGAFENIDASKSRHYFTATRYHGDERGGCVEWTWIIEHSDDFLGMPTAGKKTCVKGMTVHKFDGGKIIVERSMWDVGCLMRQIGLPAPAEKFEY